MLPLFRVMVTGCHSRAGPSGMSGIEAYRIRSPKCAGAMGAVLSGFQSAKNKLSGLLTEIGY